MQLLRCLLNLPQGTKNILALCTVADRLGRYNSMEVSVLGDHEVVARELHTHIVKVLVCWRAKGFASIPATVRP